MIRGVGVDVVALDRFERALGRTPRLRDRLFAESERGLPVRSLAARFAAKEALIKALGGDAGLRWGELEVPDSRGEAPRFARTTALEAVFLRCGVARSHLSLSHDAGLACAFVVLEGVDP